LKYGRDDETQSDDLGLRYMTVAGYAPQEMPKVFHTLGRTTDTSAGARVPEWQSTHPAPENREQRIKGQIAKLPPPLPDRIDRAKYLEQVDGLVYGPDPRAGFFDASNVFHHPELALKLRFPSGWKTANQPTAVLGVSPEQDALIQLELVPEKDAKSAAAKFFAQQGVQHGTLSSTPINGLASVSAPFAAASQQGNLQGRASFVELGGHVYRIIGVAPQQRFQARSAAIDSTLGSFAPETDELVLRVKPWRIEIVTPPRSYSIAEFAQQYPGPATAEELAILNQIDPGQRYAEGVAVKRVVGKPLP
jgi:predicted Zn-dependent protease